MGECRALLVLVTLGKSRKSLLWQQKIAAHHVPLLLDAE